MSLSNFSQVVGISNQHLRLWGHLNWLSTIKIHSMAFDMLMQPVYHPSREHKCKVK